MNLAQAGAQRFGFQALTQQDAALVILAADVQALSLRSRPKL